MTASKKISTSRPTSLEPSPSGRAVRPAKPSGGFAAGQLVWCPSDPLLGVGLTVAAAAGRITVRFPQADTERQFTTRTSEVAIVRYLINNGELVTHGEETVRVAALAEQVEGRNRYRLDDGRTVDESTLEPRVRDVGPKERLAALTLSHPEAVRARMLGQRLAHTGGNAARAAILGARAQWLSHQLDVATQAVGREPVRLLLADEVGLGKTVEAALIYAGLRAQQRAARVLVLTPASLAIQWLEELFRKSHELLVLFDQARIEDARAEDPEGNPFEAHQRMVASIDTVSRDPVLAHDCERAPWDLVIVDEAHHLRWQASGGGNLSYRLVESLAARTTHLLLLSATPMALDPKEHQQLLRLLSPVRFSSPSLDGDAAERATSMRQVARTLQQATLSGEPISEDTQRAAESLLLDDAEDTAALGRLVATAPAASERQALLTPVLEALRERHALSDFVTRNRRGPVGGLPARHAETFALQPSEAQELLIDVGEEIMLELALTVPDKGDRARLLGELLRALWATPRALIDILRPYSQALCEQLRPHVEAVVGGPLDNEGLPTGDMRLRWLAELGRKLEGGEKLLVFVESNIAVRALKDALAPLVKTELAIFHRDLSPRDQDRQVAWFRDPAGPQIMLSTEAGGEGRNFQFCHRVVLYDLPWRPATVEQRIGRIDRVGQTKDVEVLVPHWASGFEAAIAKVMQQSIGVLSETVGGIDHALEYVSEQLAELIVEGAGADAWKALYQSTAKMVRSARARMAEDIDPVLDHASYQPARVEALLRSIPANLEAELQSFVTGYAEHNRLDLAAKGGQRVVVEGAPSAAPGSATDGFVGTFGRQDALDHEDLEFLSFGHPLVDQALEWSQSGVEASAGLALVRGSDVDGAAFLWQFNLVLPDEASVASPYFAARSIVLALDEAGKRRPALESLVEPHARRLERMDATPLRSSLERWRMLVARNFSAAEALADAEAAKARALATEQVEREFERRARAIKRRAMRQLLDHQGKADAAAVTRIETERASAEASHEETLLRVRQAIAKGQPRLACAMAVRLVRKKEVSA